MRIPSSLGSWFVASLLLAAAPAQKAVHGRLDTVGDLKVLQVWGTPAERGYAHGFLLGKEIASTLVAEWTARFTRARPMLDQARGAVGRLIAYPDDVRDEIAAVFEGIVESKASLEMPELERAFDLQDLLVANALDVFGLMGCSSFTVWDDRVDGGGVLTARNFDWPLTGKHLLDTTMVIVQHFGDGHAVASVGWPGFVGTVTGLSKDGVAAFLHVGSAKITMMPEPDSWPTAIAARRILAAGPGEDPATTFAACKKLLEYTSPPAGYATHVVLPKAVGGAGPAAVFETDAKSCVQAELVAGSCVLTNHFRTRKDGRQASRDSLGREKRVTEEIGGCIDTGDHRVSVAEAWTILESVSRDGRGMGTLHSVVFRHEPWVFELRIAALDAQGAVVGAPKSERRYSLTRDQVFPSIDAETAPR